MLDVLPPMKPLRTFLIVIAAFLAVFWEAAFPGTARWLHAQVDLLPPLIVYASLCTELTSVALLAVFGGLLLDSLSADPLGVTMLPLFAVGLAVYWRRELILRDQPYAQFVLGLGRRADADTGQARAAQTQRAQWFNRQAGIGQLFAHRRGRPC